MHCLDLIIKSLNAASVLVGLTVEIHPGTAPLHRISSIKTKYQNMRQFKFNKFREKHKGFFNGDIMIIIHAPVQLTPVLNQTDFF